MNIFTGDGDVYTWDLDSNALLTHTNTHFATINAMLQMHGMIIAAADHNVSMIGVKSGKVSHHCDDDDVAVDVDVGVVVIVVVVVVVVISAANDDDFPL